MKKQTKKALASTLGLARSTLYYHHKLRPVRDASLLSAITAVMAEHPAYGPTAGLHCTLLGITK